MLNSLNSQRPAGASKVALIVRGGWSGHHPIDTTDVFLPFLKEQGYEVRISRSTTIYADATQMSDVDLIVQCITMSSIEPEEFEGLDAAVRRGVGFAGWHGGIVDSFRDSRLYLQLVGGQLAEHPSKPEADRVGDAHDNDVSHVIEMTAAGAEHPITTGIDDFELSTEQYWVLTDDYNTVLATTTHPSKPGDPWDSPVTCPALWTRNWGQGRIFVATPGHTPDVLEAEPVRTIVERGLLWASR
ncbi:ThuA domain-containing protein [Salinibacterium sp. PAMC 21357]|uniref:ThuA domain-containing protein n=1 Tax=Salinibacterium sp. PAMC 21357 TaxID=1112215 RepID=UPI0002F4DC81|nr:ThuA domain-containing protein [Salinibacterium sp. PAMC 21357]